MDTQIIETVAECGFDVYMMSPTDTWLYYTDGKNIGYLQYDHMSGFTIATEHVPCRTNGTGFLTRRHYGGPLTEEILREAFAVCPTGFPRRRGDSPVVKYKDMRAFLTADKWHAGYKCIAEGKRPTTEEPSLAR